MVVVACLGCVYLHFKKRKNPHHIVRYKIRQFGVDGIIVYLSSSSDNLFLCIIKGDEWRSVECTEKANVSEGTIGDRLSD